MCVLKMIPPPEQHVDTVQSCLFSVGTFLHQLPLLAALKTHHVSHWSHLRKQVKIIK